MKKTLPIQLTFAMVLAASAATAAPEYYEFKITNIEERFCDFTGSGSSLDPYVCQSSPAVDPVFGNTPTVNVSFFYDASVTGIAFSEPGSVTYPSPITDLTVRVNGFEHTRANTNVAFNDATASGSAPAEDALVVLGFVFFQTGVTTFDISYNNETYTSEDLLMVFAQGATGADFFPDSALDGPTGRSAVPLPSELPPAGADFTLFSLGFDSASRFESNPNQATSRYAITGEITVVPVPAAVWLFGSGLGLLGFVRRKKLLAA